MAKFRIIEHKTIQIETIVDVKDAKEALQLYKTNKAPINEVSEDSRVHIEEILEETKEVSIDE